MEGWVSATNWWVLKTLFLSLFAANESELDCFRCPSQFISRTGPAAACPSAPTGALQSPGDELWSSDPQACVSHFFSNKKRCFPFNVNQEGSMSLYHCRSSCGGKEGAKNGCPPPPQKKKNIYKRLLYTQLFNQKVRGGDSGSSGQSSANWDPEWSEHSQPTLGNWKQHR